MNNSTATADYNILSNNLSNLIINRPSGKSIFFNQADTTTHATFDTSNNFILNSGNFAVGNFTPSYAVDAGAASLNKAFRIGSIIGGTAGNSYGVIGYNAKPSALNAWQYDVTDVASWIQFLSGGHVFYRGISGTGGNSITPLESARFNASGNLGINSTSPTSRLDVIGDARVSGVVTATTFNGQINANAGVGTITTLSGTTATYDTGNFTTGNIVTGVVTTLTSTNATLTNINSTGISTLGVTTVTNLTAQNINNSGITTTNSLNIDATQVISSLRQLQNIASLDATTTATIESAIANAPNNFNDLNVTGISTLGVTSATNLTAQQLNVSGVSTISVNSSIDALRITQLGTGNALVVEDSANPDATPFVIDASGQVGIGTTNPSNKLDVYGRVSIGGAGISNALSIRRVSDNNAGVSFGYPSTTSNSEFSLRHNAGGGEFTIHLNGTGGEQGNAFNEKFRFTSAAQLGIGRSNPSVELDVFGGANFTNRVLIGSATSTGTASQSLQVTGGGYFSSSVGIGITNPEKLLHLSTSVSTPLIIQRTTINNSAAEYRNTADSMWAGLLSNATGWGVGATADLGSDAQIVVTRTGGELLVGSVSTTGTSSQKLQVTGGAYIQNNLGIGSTNPTSKLYVVGNAYITGVTTSTDFDSLSDMNLKTNINQIANPLEKVMQIRGVTFNWKDGNRNSAGVIAQEIEKILPELVHGGETKTVNYNGLIGLLIECVKKQQEEIDELKRKVN